MQTFFTTFLQIVLIVNSYWFAYGPPLTLFFYLLITTRYISNLFLKKNGSFSIFIILVTIKKFIDLKSKTKYTNPKKKKISSTTKITSSKTKKKKKSESTNFIQNKQPYPLKNSKQK